MCCTKAFTQLFSCVFKSFHLRHDITYNSTKLIISSKFILQILSLNVFHKKTIECLSCKLLPSCSQFCNVLETFRSSNCPKSNEFCQKFHFWKALLNISKISPRFSKKSSILVLLNKFFVEYFYKNILQKYSSLHRNRS